jgi:hypothetical protein
LANCEGYVYEHRKVLYDKLGAGPHACHWCGLVLGWDKMTADHLNAVRDDNREENLVPSCLTCNQARGNALPFLSRVSRERLAEQLRHLDTP